MKKETKEEILNNINKIQGEFNKTVKEFEENQRRFEQRDRETSAFVSQKKKRDPRT